MQKDNITRRCQPGPLHPIHRQGGGPVSNLHNSSVMLLDNAHRIRQNEEKCSWVDSDPHSRVFYLECRSPLTDTNGRSSTKSTTHKNELDAQGREIAAIITRLTGATSLTASASSVAYFKAAAGTTPKPSMTAYLRAFGPPAPMPSTHTTTRTPCLSDCYDAWRSELADDPDRDFMWLMDFASLTLAANLSQLNTETTNQQQELTEAWWKHKFTKNWRPELTG